MKAKWGCLTILALLAIAWNLLVWTAQEPPDVGGPALMLLGLLALGIIYAGSALERRTTGKRLPRPQEPGSRDVDGRYQRPNRRPAGRVLWTPW